MLNQHPQLHVINETHWIPKLVEFYGSGRAPVAEMLNIVRFTHHVNGQSTTKIPEALIQQWQNSEAELTVREFCDVLANALAEVQQKTLVADKTPDYVSHLQLLQQLWPEARFVHLIRDGAAAAQSMAQHKGYQALLQAQEMTWVAMAYGAEDSLEQLGLPDLAESLRLWRIRVARAQNEAQGLKPGSYLEIRFEDLLAEPLATLEQLGEFCQLAASNEGWIERASAMIDPKRLHRRGRLPNDLPVDAATRALMQRLGYGASLPKPAST